MNPEPTPVADAATKSNSAPRIAKDLVRTAYQVFTFIEATGAAYLDEIPHEIGLTVEYICRKYHRPEPPAEASKGKERQTKRSSAEPPAFPSTWATDTPQFRRVIKAFADRTRDFRSLPQLVIWFRKNDHPSTGTTPERSVTPIGEPSEAAFAALEALARLTSTQPTTGGNNSATETPNTNTTNTSTGSVMDEAAIRRIVNEAVTAAVTATQTANRTPANQGSSFAAPTGNAGAVPAPNSRWTANDLGFFDPNYDDKTVHSGAAPIEYAGKDTFFRDIHLFIDRAKQFVPTKTGEAVRENLWLSLRGTALSWWTSELSETERRITTYGKDVDEWSKLLIKRFKQPSFVAMTSLLKESYTLRDAAAKREPREFAQRMLRTAKDAGINDPLPQLDMIYTNIDLNLRMFLQRPTERSSIDSFLTELDDRKYEWWAYAGRKVDNHGPSYRSERPRPNNNNGQRQFNQGQYSRQLQQPSYGSMPQRPMVEGFRGFQPFYGSNNPYGSGRPALPYQTRPFIPYNQGNNLVNQMQQPYQPFRQQPPPQQQNSQQQNLQPTRPPLQITNGAQNANANQYPGQRNFTNQQPNQGQGGNFNRPDFNRNPFRKPFVPRAYHAEGQENTHSHDEQDDYDRYEDAFYQGASWAAETHSAEAYPNDPLSDEAYNEQAFTAVDDQDQEMQDSVEAHFITPPAPKSHKCRNCEKSFSSNNLLHKHLLDCRKATATSTEPTRSKGIEAFSIQVIESSATDKPTPGRAFRGYRFATVKISLTYQGKLYEYCFDTGCTMSLIDRAFLKQIMAEGGINIEIKKMASPIKVRGLGTKEHDACEYAIIPMYVPNGDGSKVALIRREIHIVDDLSAKALIGIDIMKPEGIILDTARDIAVIGSCNSLQVPMSMIAKGPRTDTAIVSKARYSVPAHSFVTIAIEPVDLPKDRDLIFEPEQLDALTLSAHIVDHNLSRLLIRNDTNLPVTLSRHVYLGKVLEYEAEGCFQIDPNNATLAQKPPKKEATKSWIKRGFQSLLGMAAAFNAATSLSGPAAETVHSTGATIYGNTAASQAIAGVVEAFPNLWKDTGNANIPEEQWMEIPLVDNWEDIYKAGQARVYPVGKRDKQVIDDAFDKLHQQGRIDWTNSSTPFSFPCFVVWKDTADGPKGRVVVDIRALNKITVPDAYPVPSQAEILALIIHCSHISTIDAAAFFYQWWVKYHHRHRLTVSSHRGQETFNVPVMGYRNSPAYVQRMIDRILRPFRHFCRAYVDDIVIFSTSLEEHVKHLTMVFGALSDMNIHLAPAKAFLGYPSVQLLGQHVDALGLATAEDKLAAIRNLEFPKTLAALERYLGMTGYLKQYVPYYSAIVKPLQERKTMLNRSCGNHSGNARKSEAGRSYLQMPTPQELNAYHQLQGIFASPTLLHHHDPSRQLYVDLDASKEFGFGAHIYHSKKDLVTKEDSATVKESRKASSDAPKQPSTTEEEAPKQKSMQPILFLSRQLTSAETRYWPTELEMAGIVWVVKKIRHLIEASTKPTIIYTDHSAAIGIVRQSSMNTTSTEKLNLRLIRASEYLQRFRIELRHKPGKTNIVPDALSRLASRSYRSEPESSSILDNVDSFPVSLITVSEGFRKRLIEGYQEPRWTKVIATVKANDDLGANAAKLPYKLVDDLLYFDGERGLRLCLPTSMEAEVFKLAHDEMGHPGYARTHERLTGSIYIYNMATKLHEYLRHCPHCQLHQTPRHLPYGSLQPIYTPSRPFHTITIDFILALPKASTGEDCAMSVTDKFSKALTFIAGEIRWNGTQWARKLLARLLLLNWGLPEAVISDRDRRFIGELWQTILKLLKVDLLFSTAWHPQTDGQSEKSNEIAEIALRHFILTVPHGEWPKTLPQMSAALNNSTKYSSTHLASTEVLFGFKVREPLDLLNGLKLDDLIEEAALPQQDAAPTQQGPSSQEASLPKPSGSQSQVPSSESKAIEVRIPVASTNRRSSRIAGKPPTVDVATAIHAFPANNSQPNYRPHHVDAQDALAFASLRMKDYYDAKHKPMFFNVGDHVHLRLHRGYQMAGVQSRKLGQQFAGPFQVVERIGRLAYRLKLPPTMRIHDVVSVAHLEPATDPASDPYGRPATVPPAVVVDNHDEYEIERLVKKRQRRYGRAKTATTEYLVRWKGCGPQDDQWIASRNLANAPELIKEYEEAFGSKSGLATTSQATATISAFPSTYANWL